MEAGRELDALVAKHVMEWEDISEQYPGCSPKWFVPDEKFARKRGGTRILELLCPAFSTDISAAWEVVEKLRTDHIFSLEGEEHEKHRRNLWTARFLYEATDGGEYGAFAASAPHAICLAALKAVGVEMGE